jgi:23S rRNA (guanosine2251-2'-O)-methyltransferase
MEKKDMIYGTRAVIEALRAGRQIEKILVQKNLSNDLVKEMLALARERQVPVLQAQEDRLKRLSSKNHQGVICILSSVNYASLDNIIHQAYSEGRDPFVLLLDRITDVRNFGAIARTAECAGVDAIVVPDKGSAPIASDAMKTSAGALNHLPVCREKDLKATLRFLHDNGVKVIACTEKSSTSLYTLTLTGPIAILMGSEEDGISENLLRTADELAAIPMKGEIGSLNVSVAAGVALYEVIRQRA